MRKIFISIILSFLFFNLFSQTDSSIIIVKNSLNLNESETELWDEYHGALQYKLLDLSRTINAFISVETKINASKNNLLKLDFYIGCLELYRFNIEYDKCRKYIKKVDSLFNIGATNNYLKIRYYNRKAAFFTQTEQSDSSVFYSKFAIDLSKKIGYNYYIGSSLNEMAYIYSYSNKKKAEEIFREAIKVCKKIKDTASLVLTHTNYIRYLFEQNRYNEGKQILDSNRYYLKNTIYYHDQESMHAYYMSYFAHINKPDSILFHSEKRLKWKIEEALLINNDKIAYIESHFKDEQQKNTILKQKEAIKQEQNMNKRFMFFSIILIAGLVIILLLSAFLLKSKKQVSNQLKKINKAKDKLQIILSDKELLLKEVHHRVKNNFSLILGFLEYQLWDNEDENIKKVITETQNRINSISIAHELIYGEFLVDKDYQLINLKKYIRAIINAVTPINNKGNSVKINLNIEKINLNIDTCLPIGILVNELVTNSFKHVLKKQNNLTVDISISLNDDLINLTYEDNGEGFDIDKIKKYSLGVFIIKSMIKQLKGSYSYNKNKAAYDITLNLKNNL